MRTNPGFRFQLNEIAEGGDASSLFFEFDDSCMDELAKGLEAPVCEFVCEFFHQSLHSLTPLPFFVIMERQ